jgi:hypothetical protein
MIEVYIYVIVFQQIKSLHSDLNIQRQAAVAAAETAEQKFNEQVFCICSISNVSNFLTS